METETPQTEPNNYMRRLITFSASVVLFQDVNNPARRINTAKCATRVSTPYRKYFQTRDDIDIDTSYKTILLISHTIFSLCIHVLCF